MDVEQIAAGLSEAQRRLVLASGPDDITREEGFGVEIRGSGYRTAKSLEASLIGFYTHGSPYGDLYYNSPLGLAVRQHLIEKGDG